MVLTFGERLKTARQSKKMTQKELALKIGAKHNSISDWENNKNKPDPDTIELLCGILEISPNYLIGSKSGMVFSPTEIDILKDYRSLDSHGKEMVDFVLEKESARCKSAASSHLTPIAAHNDTEKDEQIRLMREDIDEL